MPCFRIYCPRYNLADRYMLYIRPHPKVARDHKAYCAVC